MPDAERLLDWYQRHRRVLPWRKNQDPYRVWVSEIMLQQTRVETATPFFERFMARFPTVDALATSPLDEVLSYWSGLGYYRRCRLMHQAAIRIARDGFPRTVAGLEELPGVGPYTAAAIASIAFNIVVPVLDGNVERVVSRYRAVDLPPRSADGKGKLREGARSLLVSADPGDSNQALMELGATVCTPRRPRCLVCPLSENCKANLDGTVERFPLVSERRAQEKVHLALAVVGDGPRVLLFRRPDDSDLLAGTWELPWIAVGAEDDRAAIEAGLAERYGGSWRLGSSRGKVRHSITHRAIQAEVFEAELRYAGVVAEGPEAGWFDRAARTRLPTSSLVAKALGKNVSPAASPRLHHRRRRA